MKAAIIGIGLIGGSFALSLREHALAQRVMGVDNDPQHAGKALEMGLVDELCSVDEAVEKADLIVLSVPVDAIPGIAIKLLNRIGPHQIVMDMGSTKEELCELISMHPVRRRFVATHPMWGTEYSGPQAAVRDGFGGRTVVICEREKSDVDAVNTVERIYTQLGMPVRYMDPQEHDIHTAYVSHISHITSFALALTVLEKEREESHIFDLAGGGFESTVRLAKSSPQTWASIFLQNKYNVLDVLREHIHQLQILRKMIEKDDRKGLLSLMEKANSIREIIE